MVVDVHTHLFGKGWVPDEFFYGVARFITHAMAKEGIHQDPREVGETLMDGTSDSDAEMLLAEMDEAGIDMSVIFPVDFGFELGEPQVPIGDVNRAYADLARKHPRRLIAFAGLDPRRRNAPDLFRQCVQEWGMRGLKLHPCAGFYPNQKETYALLELAGEWGLPVLIHSGNMMVPLRSKYSQAIYFDDLGADFPDLTIIAAHAGGTLNYMAMLAIMGVKLNILVDISGWQATATKNFDKFCRGLRDLLDFAERDRILFGSDSPSFRSIMSNTDWVQLIRNLPRNAPDGLAFTQEEVDAILGGNARRVLKL